PLGIICWGSSAGLEVSPASRSGLVSSARRSSQKGSTSSLLLNSLPLLTEAHGRRGSSRDRGDLPASCARPADSRRHIRSRRPRRGREFALGVLNVETGVETTVDSLFQIGPVIKLLTATLEMQLVDDGLVDLDAPASEYLPGLRFGEGCTVRDLLTHSSGVDGDLVEDFGRGDDAIGRYVDARACRSEPQGSACRRSVRVVRMDARVQEPVCSTTLPSQWQARSASSTSSRPSRRGRPRSSSAFWTRYWAVFRWRKSWSAVAV
ncbi:MAG: hypothetical protein QOG36_63, partial [Actinomycetota bacterium]|nr:hypothetical protein [Actinomycetota bacterium]